MAIWPFGRRRDADEPTPEPDAAESASPAAGEADVARPERVPTGDWMTMPPVRTSMAPAMPTTFRVQTLPEILTSHHDTRLSSSLGHAVSSDAPSGVIGGLARATSSLGAVSHEGTGGAPSVLKEPAHPARPEPEPAPPIQRRLTASTDAPLAVSSPGPMGTTAAPPAPALPEPAVSRVLASPGPMPSPAALGANPLPVARVIDTTPAASRPAAASTADSPTSPASTPSSSEGSPAGAEPGPTADDRVGGFEVDLTSLLGGQAGDDDLPIITPPADLAPPIQRSVRRDATPPILRSPVQRSADRAAPAPAPAPPAITSAPPAGPAPTGATGADAAPPASGAASERAPGASPGSPGSGGNTADLPPIQRRADASPASSSASSTSESSATPPAGGPSPAGADAAPAAVGERPTAGADALAPPDTPPLSSAGTATPAPAGAGPDLTLVSPPVQRSAESGADTGHFPGDGHDHGDDEGAVQRTADTAPAPTPPTPDSPASTAAPDAGAPTAPDGSTGDDAPAAGSSVEAPATAPIAGDDPLTPVSDAAPLAGDGTGDEPAGDTAGEALPLVARHAEPAAPTLGTTGDPGPSLLPLQTLSDTAQTHTEGSGPSMPLAPADQPGTLTPPAAPGPNASTATAGLVGDGPLPTVSGGPATPSTTGPGSTTSPRPLVAQRQAESGTSTSAGGPGPLAVVAQRSVAGSARGESAAAPTAPSLRPLASSAGSLLLASPASAGGSGTSPSGPMTVLGSPSAEATAVPLQRSVGADGFAAPILAAPTARSGAGAAAPDAGGAPATSSGPSLPLARSTSAPSGETSHAAVTPVTPLVAQRAADDGASSGSSAMPLHTAAAAVPSTTDLLVKAGLGEKGPDGSFLRSTPPAGVASSFTVQTMPDGTTSAPSPSAPAVQREVTVGEVSSEVGGGGGGAAAESTEDVRKLYRKLRAELEADLRRQLEAKSRYNRYRP